MGIARSTAPAESGSRRVGYDALAAAVVPVCLFAALLALALGHADPGSTAELRRLALLSGLTLACVGALATDSGLLAGIASIGVFTAALVVPSGPTRGAVVHVLLIAAVAGALVTRTASREERWPLAALLALTLSVRLLTEPTLLLQDATQPTGAALLLGSTLLASLGLIGLLGDRSSLLVVVLASTVAASSTLDLRVAVLLAAAGLASTLSRHGWRPWGLWLLALAGCAAVASVDVRVSALCAITFLGWWAVGSVPRLALAAGLLAAVQLLFPGEAPWSSALGQLGWLPLILPAGLLMASRAAPAVGVALLLAIAGARWVPTAFGLIPAILLIADRLPRDGKWWPAQRVWSAALLLVLVVLLGYPWIREAPLSGVASGFQGASFGHLALLAFGAFVLIGATRRPLLAMSVLLVAVSVASFRPTGEVVLQHPTSLTAASPILDLQPEGRGPVRGVALDSTLLSTLEVPPDTVVAEVRIRGVDGSWESHSVRIGRDTGDWTGSPGGGEPGSALAGPPHWLRWFVSGGLAYRYRAALRLGRPGEIDRIQVRRDSSLPPETSVLVYHLEVRR